MEYTSEVKAKKIRGLLSSFIHTAESEITGTSSQICTNAEHNTEPSSQTRYSRDKAAFLNRLKTYTPFNWFAKPTWLSPPVCARHGWQNVEQDLLQCVTCKAFVTGKMPSSFQPSVYSECCKKIEDSLKSSHHPFCPWSNNPSPESYLSVTLPKDSQIKELLEGLISFGNKLPKIKEEILMKLDVKIASLQKLQDSFGLSDKCDQSIFISASVLLICGWHTKGLSPKSPLVSCSNCSRECGLWNYISQFSDSGSEESGDDEEIELFSPLKKNASLSVRNNKTLSDINVTNSAHIVTNGSSLTRNGVELNSVETNISVKCKSNSKIHGTDKVTASADLIRTEDDMLENTTGSDISKPVVEAESKIKQVSEVDMIIDTKGSSGVTDKKRSNINDIVHSLKSKIEQTGENVPDQKEVETEDVNSIYDSSTKKSINDSLIKDGTIKLFSGSGDSSHSESRETSVSSIKDETDYAENSQTDASKILISDTSVNSETDKLILDCTESNESINISSKQQTTSVPDHSEAPEQARNGSDSEDEAVNNESFIQVIDTSSEDEEGQLDSSSMLSNQGETGDSESDSINMVSDSLNPGFSVDVEDSEETSEEDMNDASSDRIDEDDFEEESEDGDQQNESDEIMVLSSESEGMTEVVHDNITDMIPFQPLDVDETHSQDVNIDISHECSDESNSTHSSDQNLNPEMGDITKEKIIPLNSYMPDEVPHEETEQNIPENGDNEQSCSGSGNIKETLHSMEREDCNNLPEQSEKVLTYIRECENTLQCDEKILTYTREQGVLLSSGKADIGKVNINVSHNDKCVQEEDNEVESVDMDVNEEVDKNNGSLETTGEISNGVKEHITPHENSETSESKTVISKKRKKKPTKMLFNPLAEHRPWCPWVNGNSEDSVKSNDCKPGWKQMVINIVPQASPEKEDFIKFVKTSPPYESLRRIRRLFNGWASPQIK